MKEYLLAKATGARENQPLAASAESVQSGQQQQQTGRLDGVRVVDCRYPFQLSLLLFVSTFTLIFALGPPDAR